MMASSDYLITSNNAYIKLNNYFDTFEAEAMMIEEAKCLLMNYEKLEDFSTSYGNATVIDEGGNYIVEYNGNNYYLKVENNMIVDYFIQ